MSSCSASSYLLPAAAAAAVLVNSSAELNLVAASDSALVGLDSGRIKRRGLI